MFKSKITYYPILLCTLVIAIYTLPSFASDRVILTFSTVGDSRQDLGYPDPSVINHAMVDVGSCQTPSGNGLKSNPGLTGQDCKWLQNSKAWSRILRTIQSQKVNLLFFNGDMIMGYGRAGVPVSRSSNGTDEKPIISPTIDDIINSDVMQSYKQYAFWRGMVANLMETGTYVVPVPGNHEVQCKRCSKIAQVENENAWRDNMGDLILDPVRFSSILGMDAQNFDVNNTPNSSDGITTDQSQLSYSFDVGSNHFVVINTDPVGSDGHAPTNWLEADLNAAETRGAKHIFVFGHKPVVYYQIPGVELPNSQASLYDMDGEDAAAFWNVINAHQATYFCGHEHTYNITKPFSLNSYQVLVGAGGSPFESSVATLVPSDRMYSWATVKVYKSGRVVMDTWGFDDTMTKPLKKLATIRLAVR